MIFFIWRWSSTRDHKTGKENRFDEEFTRANWRGYHLFYALRVIHQKLPAHGTVPFYGFIFCTDSFSEKLKSFIDFYFSAVEKLKSVSFWRYATILKLSKITFRRHMGNMGSAGPHTQFCNTFEGICTSSPSKIKSSRNIVIAGIGGNTWKMHSITL